jgi:protein phosphatase
MGVVLPKPILSKVVERFGDTRVQGAVCSVNGYRNSMEDDHCCVVAEDRFIIGVFDGHTSERCSRFVAEHLPRKLLQLPLPISDETHDKTAVDLDEQFLEDVHDGGSTATYMVVEPADGKYAVTVCNVGDSRILITSGGQLKFATVDHKPSLPGEQSRIEACGGFVRMNRVDGDLAVSRAFGDEQFKKNGANPRQRKVIAVPDVTHHECAPGDVIIVACDGVFEGSFSNLDVVAFVSRQLEDPATYFGDLGVVAGRVCDQAIRRGSKDNITCMVVQFAPITDTMKNLGPRSFLPGPPPPRENDQSRNAYGRMAQMGGMTLGSAFAERYKILQNYKNNVTEGCTPLQRIAFEMSDEVDIETEMSFFGKGPQGDPQEWFEHLGE